MNNGQEKHTTQTRCHHHLHRAHNTILQYSQTPWHYNINPDRDCCVKIGTTEHLTATPLQAIKKTMLQFKLQLSSCNW